jgi:L-amino acid N-acyltransferase YncA
MSVQIRLASDADAEAIAAIYRPVVETTSISFETEAPDAAEMRRRLAATLPSHPWLVCAIDGDVAGYAYATAHRVRAAYRWSVDTSVYIDGSRRRLGIGRGLYQSLFAVLAAQGHVNAFAGIALPNPGSVGLHEAVGFEPLGIYRRVGFKFGAWHDVGWWQLALKAHEAAPDVPLGLDAVRCQPEWPGLLACGEASIRARAA